MQGKTSAIKTKRIQQSITQYYRLNNRREYKKTNIKRNRKKEVKSPSQFTILRSNNLKPISYLEIEQSLSVGLFKEGDNVLDIIEQLYPKMKDDLDAFLGSKYFSENTKPIDFLTWMLRCYDEVNPNPWEIYKDEEDEEFHIRKYFEYWDIGNNGRSVGLRFMPKIKKKNKPLYEMLTSMFGLFSDKMDIPFWFTDYNLHCAIDSIGCMIGDYEYEVEEGGEDAEAAKENIEWYQDSIDEYTGGNPYEVGIDIQRPNMSLELLKEMVSKYKPRRKDRKMCLALLQKGIELLEINQKFPEFVNMSIAESGEHNPPGTAYDFACIGWTYEDDDPVAGEVMNFYKCRSNEGGVAPFREVYTDDEIVEPREFPMKYVDILTLISEIEQLMMMGGL